MRLKTCIKTFERPDERAKVTFLDHGSGLYSFEEEQEFHDEVPGIGPYAYWIPTYVSGLYNDLAAVECEAKAVIPWLRDVSGR